VRAAYDGGYRVVKMTLQAYLTERLWTRSLTQQTCSYKAVLTVSQVRVTDGQTDRQTDTVIR